MSLISQWQFWSLPWLVLGISYHRKLSLTGQWQFWISLLIMSLTGQWQIFRQSHLELVNGQSRESLTIHFGYGHTTYGQMSLTTVNDKNLWTKLKKKCHWPWSMTKKLSLTESDLSFAYIRHIFGLSEVYLWHNLGILWAFLWTNLAQIGDILGISVANRWHD